MLALLAGDDERSIDEDRHDAVKVGAPSVIVQHGAKKNQHADYHANDADDLSSFLKKAYENSTAKRFDSLRTRTCMPQQRSCP